MVFPTTIALMNDFLERKITEKELFDLTPLGVNFDAIYLCSALVLEEYRNKGIAKKLTLEAIERIRKDYPIKFLFVWAFTKEGGTLSSKIASEVNLPLKNYGKFGDV